MTVKNKEGIQIRVSIQIREKAVTKSTIATNNPNADNNYQSTTPLHTKYNHVVCQSLKL